MRVIIDQWGYEFLNIGDVAMLQSCFIRLSKQWPTAEIGVICHAPQRLGRFCPGAKAVDRRSHELLVRAMPHKYRILGRNASAYLARRRTVGGELNIEPRDEIEAVRGADVLVAAGGGYVTDTWLTHATGVLGLLSLAQRLGKPTAMFGQGIGPISRPSLKMQARAVLPRLTTLGLREGTLSRPLARSYGVRADRTIVTGDDALELIDGTEASTGQFLGINMRVSNYSGVNDAAAASVGRALLTLGDPLWAEAAAVQRPALRRAQTFRPTSLQLILSPPSPLR